MYLGNTKCLVGNIVDMFPTLDYFSLIEKEFIGGPCVGREVLIVSHPSGSKKCVHCGDSKTYLKKKNPIKPKGLNFLEKIIWFLNPNKDIFVWICEFCNEEEIS